MFGLCGRESAEDLDRLYEVLGRFRDHRGAHPVFTMNFVLANPDYEAIEASGFKTYSWIPIDDVAKLPGDGALIDKYKEGVARGLVCPQYHGRDHFSGETWLAAIRGGDPVAVEAFRLRVPWIAVHSRKESEYAYGEGAHLDPLPKAAIEAKIEDGMTAFERLFGRTSLTSIAPCYHWCDQVERALYARGVRCVQAAGHRVMPLGAGRLACPRPAWFGLSNSTAMRQLNRTCRFEPAQLGSEAVPMCMETIASAFSRGLPAVVDTHRVSYVSAIDKGNRDRGLEQLGTLLEEILSRFPDVRFASSEMLARAVLATDQRNGMPGGEDIRLGSWARRVRWVLRERLQWWREGH